MNQHVLRQGILLLGIILLVLPLGLRMINQQPLVLGEEGYGHMRMAALIAREGIPAQDPALPDRAYDKNLFDLVLAGIAMVIGIETAALLLPLLLGLGTLWCFTRVLHCWKIPQANSIGMLLVFLVSPLFVNVFTQPTPRALELFLLVLLVLVLAPIKQASPTALIARSLAAFVIAGMLATFSMVSAIVAVLVPLLVRTIDRRLPQHLLGASVVAFIVLVTKALPAFLQRESPVFARSMPVVQAIADVSGGFGLSLFAWLLACIGLVLLWRFKRTYYAAMIATSVALVVALLLPSAVVTAHVIVSFLAGSAIGFFARMRWSFDDIRMLTLLVLVCGLLFSTLAHAMALAQGPPTRDMKTAMLAVKDVLPEHALVLAHPRDGFWVAYWSGKRVFLDGWLSQIPHVNERWATAQAIWHAQEIAMLQPGLSKNKIDALVITQEMQKGLVWELPEEDLLFLLQNNETFKNVYRSSSVEVWAVLPTDFR
jgi:hypothetical protein